MEENKIYELVGFSESAEFPQTKFGGNPDWIEEPQWPMSAETNEQMRFICQINLGHELPEYSGKVAYIFMTEDDDEYVDGTWEPDGGENAVIIQPSGKPLVPVKNLSEGPTREEYGVNAVLKQLEDSLEGVRIGGQPVFLQYEEYPEPKTDWVFIAQIDSCSLPFGLNFGDAGVGYAFVNKDGTSGKFLWQCH